jgi:hypothetical protein
MGSIDPQETEQFKNALAAATAAVHSDRFSDAFLYFGTMLGKWPHEPEGYHGAARAMVACITNESSIQEGLGWKPILRQLILQEHCAARPSILCTVLTSGDSATLNRMIPTLGRMMSGTLQSLEATGALNVNAVVVLLILRTARFTWITQRKISRLHRDWLPKFTMEDMSLPYNHMFGRGYLQLNRRDVLTMLKTRSFRNRLTNFTATHLLLFEWISSVNAFSSKEELIEYLIAGERAPGDSISCRAAVKSFLVRYSAMEAAKSDLPDGYLDFKPSLARITSVAEPIHKKNPIPAGSGLGRLKESLFHNRMWQAAQAGKSMLSARFPSIMTDRRRLKIAICVSGQLRGFRHAYPSWLRTLLVGADHSIFVHSWRAIGRSGAEPFRHTLPFEGERFKEKYREFANEHGFDVFKSRFPTLFGSLAESGAIDEQSLAQFYSTDQVVLEDDRAERFAIMSNQQKMHYKIDAAFQLAVKSGESFDMVVRIRPDKGILLMGFDWLAARNFSKQSTVVFADAAYGFQYGHLFIGDQFAVGAFEPMVIYSGAWNSYPILAENHLFQCTPEFLGHAALAQVCWVHGIDVQKAPIKFGQLHDAEPMRLTEILRCLRLDAEGRMDHTDLKLIEAANLDASA